MRRMERMLEQLQLPRQLQLHESNDSDVHSEHFDISSNVNRV